MMIVGGSGVVDEKKFWKNSFDFKWNGNWIIIIIIIQMGNGNSSCV